MYSKLSRNYAATFKRHLLEIGVPNTRKTHSGCADQIVLPNKFRKEELYPLPGKVSITFYAVRVAMPLACKPYSPTVGRPFAGTAVQH